MSNDALIRELTNEQRRLFPFTAWLMDWRIHCRDVHQAGPEDWKSNVARWHRTHHPDCDIWRTLGAEMTVRTASEVPDD